MKYIVVNNLIVEAMTKEEAQLKLKRLKIMPKPDIAKASIDEQTQDLEDKINRLN